MFSLYKIRNHSMSPSIKEGDYVLVLHINKYGFTRKKRVVVFKHPYYGTMIKQVQYNKRETLFVNSTNSQGVGSQTFGEVLREQVIGTVIWTFSQTTKKQKKYNSTVHQQQIAKHQLSKIKNEIS